VNGSKNLILGFCAPRKFDHLAPFIASLRHVGFAGDVVLLIEHTAADTVDLLRAHGVVVERAAPSGLPRMSSTASRFFGFLDYLTRFSDRYGQVMLVDPMAVVFQSDPFAAPLSADLVFTADRRRIGEIETLRDAMVQAYGEGVAENMRDCQGANPTVTVGTTAPCAARVSSWAGQHQLLCSHMSVTPSTTSSSQPGSSVTAASTAARLSRRWRAKTSCSYVSRSPSRK